MMRRKYLLASVVILIAFSLGLVGFFAFSADKPDGLENVLEENGIEEGEPVWKAPLDYGSNYTGALFAGLVGFALVFGALFFYLRITSAKKKDESKK